MEHEEIRGIVRIANKDLNGHLPIPKAILAIKGVGQKLANAISEAASKELGVDKYELVGNLSEEQTQLLEDIILNPAKHDIPSWMVNRRKDPVNAEDMHLTESDLDFGIKQDIEKERKIRSYRGIRHTKGLPVRGQRTRSTFRKGPAVGVQRKKNKPAKAGKPSK